MAASTTLRGYQRNATVRLISVVSRLARACMTQLGPKQVLRTQRMGVETLGLISSRVEVRGNEFNMIQEKVDRPG